MTSIARILPAGARIPVLHIGAFNQWLWGDACYAKNWMKLATLPDIKFIKPAMLLHDRIKSHDLADVVISEPDRRTRSSHVSENAGWLAQ